MNMAELARHHDQNFFQLACIPGMPIVLSTIILGERLTEQYEVSTAIYSILIGNLVLWLIGIAMISMSYQGRTNAIQNVKSYLGKYGGILAALVLLLVFLNWFAIVINSTMVTIESLFQFEGFWQSQVFRFGASLGMLATLFSIGQIKLLKIVTSFSFPFVMGYFLYAIAYSDHSHFIHPKAEDLSIHTIVPIILTILPGITNIPTIFRNAKSKMHSYLGLSLLVGILMFSEIASIWMPFSSTLQIIYEGPIFSLFVLATCAFLLFKAVFANVLNIYLSSACWETFFPKFEGFKGNAIMGLLGTAIYALVQLSTPHEFFRDLTNAYLACLGIVLLIGFLIQTIVQHHTRMWERVINGVAWFVGCLTETLFLIRYPEQPISSLFKAIGSIALYFLCVVFLEATIWATKKLIHEKTRTH